MSEPSTLTCDELRTPCLVGYVQIMLHLLSACLKIEWGCLELHALILGSDWGVSGKSILECDQNVDT